MWSFKERRETRKEVISKEGGRGGGGVLFKETSQTRKELISKVDGEDSPHWFHFYSRYIESRGGVVNFFSDSFMGMITESFCR